MFRVSSARAEAIRRDSWHVVDQNLYKSTTIFQFLRQNWQTDSFDKSEKEKKKRKKNKGYIKKSFES